MQNFLQHLDDYLAGTATAEQAADLEKALEAEPGLRRALVERVMLEVHLHKAFAGLAAAPVTPLGSPWVRRTVIAALAACLLLAVGIGVVGFFLRQNPSDNGPIARPGPAPVPLAVDQVIVGKVKVDGVAVEQLPAEKWFEVSGDGPAVLRLVDGTTVELSPTTKARLHGPREGSRQAVELEKGTGKFKVTPGTAPFRVETGLGIVTVLGTEFSVKLEPRGRGEDRRRRGRLVLSVVVSEGSVSVDADGKKTKLRAGDSRVFGREGRREDDD